MSAPLFFAGVGVVALGVRSAVRSAKNVNWAPMQEAFSGFANSTKASFQKVSSFSVDRSGFDNPMSTKEAYQILNLNPTATKDEVRAAHRLLMLRNHPDNGGSNFVASKINEAKTILSGGK